MIARATFLANFSSFFFVRDEELLRLIFRIRGQSGLLTRLPPGTLGAFSVETGLVEACKTGLADERRFKFKGKYQLITVAQLAVEAYG